MAKFWSATFGVVLAGAALLFVVAPFVGWWLPKAVGASAQALDNLYYLILGITGAAFVMVSCLLVYSMYRYGERPGHKAQYIHGNHRLEVIWTSATAAILVLVAVVQINAWAEEKYRSREPDPNQVVEVAARQFEWRMRYPSYDNMKKWTENWKKPVGNTGKTGQQLADEWSRNPQADDIYQVGELHIWKGTKEGDGYGGGHVRVYLKTRDVLHSFFLPQLRVKQDALPGKSYIPVWFQAIEANTKKNEETGRWESGYDPASKKFGVKEQIWELACAELCGWGHTKMKGQLYVHETREDFLAWLKDAEAKQNARK